MIVGSTVSNSKNYNGPMLPRVGDSSITLPVTVNFKGGSKEADRNRWLWGIGAIIGVLILSFGFLFGGMSLIAKMIWVPIVFYGGLWLVRMFLLQEGKYRKEMASRIANDYSIQMSNFWGIHEIRNKICYFRDKSYGMFVLLEKGPLVGKGDVEEFNHYEAVGDAFNNLGVSRMKATHIDLMDIIGQDDRIRRAYRNLSTYEDSNIKTALEMIFGNLQQKAEKTVTSYDIFLFQSKGNENDFLKTLDEVIGCLTDEDSNYVSYTVLDKKRIQTIATGLFNLHDFSVNQAMKEAFRGTKGVSGRIKAIKLEWPDGREEVINKTTYEIREEKERKAEAAKYRSREIARRQREAKEAKKAKGIVKTPQGGTINLDTGTGILGGDVHEFATGMLEEALYDSDELDFESDAKNNSYVTKKARVVPSREEEETIFEF